MFVIECEYQNTSTRGEMMKEHITFKQGVKECVPTLLGYAGVGLSFGIVAVASGFNLLEIILLCLLVYAGAAQFIICALVIAGTPISAMCINYVYC
jgi:predicted branched-subunit amino acid permease